MLERPTANLAAWLQCGRVRSLDRVEASVGRQIPWSYVLYREEAALRPGDIISTGTPSGVGVYMQPPVFLKNSDEIEIRVERIGTLRNRVVANLD